MKLVILFIIKIARKFFYNTPVHRSKLVNIIYERLFHSVYKPGSIVTVNHEGSIFSIPAVDVTLLPSLLNGTYEQTEVQILKQIIESGMVFIDIGANIGLFTVLASKLVGSKGHVYAFEPEPTNFRFLNKNIAHNKCTNVTVENVGLGHQNATLPLSMEKNSIGTHSLLGKKESALLRTVDIEVMRLDDYVKRAKIVPHIIKLDVEGYEPYVLEGAKATLKNTSYLFAEYTREHIEAYGTQKFQRLLKTFPYLYIIDEKHTHLQLTDPSGLQKHAYANIIAARKELKI